MAQGAVLEGHSGCGAEEDADKGPATERAEPQPSRARGSEPESEVSAGRGLKCSPGASYGCIDRHRRKGLGRHIAAELSRTMALVLLVGANAAEAQTLPLDPGPFPPVRYEENYRALADPAKRTGFFDAVIYMPLGSDPSS